MKETKFRQAIFLNGEFHHWHYWGFIRQGGFVPPLIVYRNQQQDTQKNSQMFTTLSDKNEVEIYEGDIIEHGEYIPDAHTCQEKIFAVRYFNDECSYNISLPEKPDYIKVIGNIYENKELLDES